MRRLNWPNKTRASIKLTTSSTLRKTKWIEPGWTCKSMRHLQHITIRKTHFARIGINSSWVSNSKCLDHSMSVWNSKATLTRCLNLYVSPSSRLRSSGSMTQKKWSWSAELKLMTRNLSTMINLSRTLSDSNSLNFTFTSTNSWRTIILPRRLRKKEDHRQPKTKTHRVSL